MNKFNILIKTQIEIEIYNSVDFVSLRNTLKDVEPLYPNFGAWLNFKFRRSLSSGERNIVLATDGTNILGLSLLKKNMDESKICTFYVPEIYRDMGIGKKLMCKSLSVLDSSDSFITVSDERQSELKPLLTSSGFKLVKSVDSLYRQKNTEHFYSF